MFVRAAATLTCLCLLSAASGPGSAAGETWHEIKSPHFTVWSDANDGLTRRLVWQLEQVRSALAAAVPSANLELSRPLLVIAARDERGMRRLAPKYWEEKGSMRPASVWVSGADRHYIAIRTDLREDDGQMSNPHAGTYFSYANLVVSSSFGRDLPLWISRGLARVLSNTIVKESELLVGLPIAWLLTEVREGPRLPLRRLLTIAHGSPELRSESDYVRFDAQAWALVHYLMFADNGAHQPRLNRLIALARAGTAPDAAFTEAVGKPEDLQQPLNLYVTNPVLRYGRSAADASVRKERFAATRLPPSRAAAGLAAFHVAMQRPAEARALIDESRRIDANEGDAWAAEALLLDQGGDRERAKAAYLRAAELSSSNPYVHYRAAVLQWPGADEPVLRRMEGQLARAIELHAAFAPAHASLAEVRAWLNEPAARIVPHLSRALTLEPDEVWHRLLAARVLVRQGALDQAARMLDAAVTLADDEASRAEAARIRESLDRARQQKGDR